MRALILCAGLGTRLRPLTERWPKPALPLLGPPLVGYTLALLKEAGVDAVGINTHHLGEQMEEAARGACAALGLGFTRVHEPVIQGTGGGIRGLRRFLEHEDLFIVFNGDILFSVDLADLVARHRQTKAAATLVLLPMPKNERYAAVECDARGEVRRIAGHGPGGDRLVPWHFTGVHILSPRIFDFMAQDGEEDINRAVYPRMMAAGLSVRGEVADGYWSDLGTPSRLLATVDDLLSGRVPATRFGSVLSLGEFLRPGKFQWVHPRATVKSSAISGPVLIEADAVVDAGARLGGSVWVGRGAQIPKGARLNRAVVMERTALEPGEELVETIAWGPHRIPAPLVRDGFPPA